MSLFKNNYFERAFAGNGLQSIVHYLRKLVNGFDSNTQTSDGGGIEGVNDRLDVVSEKLDTLNVSVKLDDPDISAINTKLGDIQSKVSSNKTSLDTIKSDVSTIKSDISTIKTKQTSIEDYLSRVYNLLNDRLPVGGIG